MIPISADKKIIWTDPDNGSVFEFLPAIGDRELLLYEAFDQISFDVSPFLEQATKKVASIKGKRWKSGEMKRAIAAEARRLALEHEKETGKREKFSAEETKKIYRALDEFVFSCTPKDGKKIEFENNASQHFNLVYNTRLLSAIMESNELTQADKKN